MEKKEKKIEVDDMKDEMTKRKVEKRREIKISSRGKKNKRKK